MQVMELKATLQRANPAVIRQFAVSMETTIKQLQEILNLLVGYNVRKQWKRWNGKREFGDDELACDLIREDSPVFFRLKGQGDLITFRIIWIGEREQTESYPKIIRARGWNLPDDINDIRRFNRLQGYWEERSYGYRYIDFYHYNSRDYLFIPQQAAAELRKRFAKAGADQGGSVSVSLDYANAVPMHEILSSYTVQELKDNALREGVRCPNGLKKSDLVDHLAAVYNNPDRLSEYVSRLTLGEYRIFQSACAGKADAPDDELFDAVVSGLSILGWMGVYRSPFAFRGYDKEYRITPSLELLDLYCGWMESGAEQEFLKKSRIYTSIRGCIRLYGAISKEQWLNLAVGWLGKEFSKEELEEGWLDYAHYLAKKPHPLAECYQDFIYHAGSFDAHLLSQVGGRMRGRTLFPASYDQIAQIEEKGLSFPAKEQSRLKSFLRSRCGAYSEETDAIAKDIYRALHCGMETADILTEFEEDLYLRNKTIRRELMEMIESFRPCVRRIDLGGYTPEEYEKRHGKQ